MLIDFVVYGNPGSWIFRTSQTKTSHHTVRKVATGASFGIMFTFKLDFFSLEHAFRAGGVPHTFFGIFTTIPEKNDPNLTCAYCSTGLGRNRQPDLFDGDTWPAMKPLQASRCSFQQVPRWHLWYFVEVVNFRKGGGNSNIFGIFHPKLGEDFHFWLIFFQLGWNHQLVEVYPLWNYSNSSHLKIGRNPIGKDRIPTIHCLGANS